jgi:hypothetical protein
LSVTRLDICVGQFLPLYFKELVIRGTDHIRDFALLLLERLELLYYFVVFLGRLDEFIVPVTYLLLKSMSHGLNVRIFSLELQLIGLHLLH